MLKKTKLRCGVCRRHFKTELKLNHPLLWCVGGELLCIDCIYQNYLNNVVCEKHQDLI